MSMHRFHCGDEPFFNPSRCAITQQTTGDNKRKGKLSTFSFRARRHKRSPFAEMLRCSPLVTRRRHNTPMIEQLDTHGTDEATETDEARHTLVGTRLISPRYQREFNRDDVSLQYGGETTEERMSIPECSFLRVGQHDRFQRTKNFIFAVEHGESVYPLQTNTLRKQNRMTAASQPNRHDDFPSWKHPYYYYYRYHSDINTRSEYTERSSVISPRYQRSNREVVR